MAKCDQCGREYPDSELYDGLCGPCLMAWYKRHVDEGQLDEEPVTMGELMRRLWRFIVDKLHL